MFILISFAIVIAMADFSGSISFTALLMAGDIAAFLKFIAPPS